MSAIGNLCNCASIAANPFCWHHTCFPCRRSRAKPEQSGCSFQGISSVSGSKLGSVLVTYSYYKWERRSGLAPTTIHFLVRHRTSTLFPGMSGWRCCLPMMAASITSAGRFSFLGPRAHLPLIEGKIGGPRGGGQYLRRALSACFLDFDHYRCRVDFRLCLSARCGNVIESRPESINPDGSLQSKCLSRLPVSAAHAPYSHHVDGNLGILRRGQADRSGAD